VLRFWETKKNVYPSLYVIATVILAVPATSAPCERVFSRAASVLCKNRHRLSNQRLRSEIFFKLNHDLFVDWLWCMGFNKNVKRSSSKMFIIGYLLSWSVNLKLAVNSKDDRLSSRRRRRFRNTKIVSGRRRSSLSASSTKTRRSWFLGRIANATCGSIVIDWYY